MTLRTMAKKVGKATSTENTLRTCRTARPWVKWISPAGPQAYRLLRAARPSQAVLRKHHGSIAMATALRQPLVVEITPGELLDKITILEIKQARFRDRAKLVNVQKELEALCAARQRARVESAELAAQIAELKTVNERLWDVEDALRQCERDGDFGPRFIVLARSVYQLNDRRAQLKRRINECCGSPWMEEKEYTAADGQ